MMTNGTVLGIYVAPKGGMRMQEVMHVLAEAAKGLAGDRYANRLGSFSNIAKTVLGINRQVTLMNGCFFGGSGFTYEQSRRNIITDGVELMWLIGREFQIGEAMFRGVKYCDPCQRPSKLIGHQKSFKEVFHDRGGLVAEVVRSGLICKMDSIIPPSKNY
jgi:MOSC domain-containing protein YiiM